MKLKATVGESMMSVDVRIEDGRISAEIDGRRYDIGFEKPNEGLFLLYDSKRVYECRVRSVDARAGIFDVSINGYSTHVELKDPRALGRSTIEGAHAGGSVRISAPMPGKVVRVLVQPGETVQRNQGLLIVEAMKMQNELKSPRDGNVASVSATEGATVNAGDVLIVIE